MDFPTIRHLTEGLVETRAELIQAEHTVGYLKRHEDELLVQMRKALARSDGSAARETPGASTG